MKKVFTALFLFLFSSLIFGLSAQAWEPAFQSPNLGWASNGSVPRSDAALYKLVGNPVYGRIYVNQNATGNNDGSSWANAYTGLQDAIANSEPGDEIWVAEGIYLPGSDPSATFLMEHDLRLFGGFAGTEFTLSERDMELHPTILSGDVNGDDVDDDYTTGREDNVNHILTIGSGTTTAALIDGFIIRNGHADGEADEMSQNGGGIYSTGTPAIRNCTFEQNYALVSGGAIGQVDYSGSTVILNNCHFNNNSAEGGMAVSILESLFDIEACTFRRNVDHSGPVSGSALAIADPYGGTVRNCTFEDNQANVGTAMLVWRRQDNDPGDVVVEILDCAFINNTATGPEDDIATNIMHLVTNGTNSSYIVKGCTFNGNNGKRGGAIGLNYNPVSTNASMLIDSCDFTMNSTVETGSSIYARMAGKDLKLEMTNCLFSQNMTINPDAGAIDLWGTNGGTGLAAVDSCVFIGNTGGIGGAIQIGNKWNGGAYVNFVVKNSYFESNQATTRGGAIALTCNFDLPSELLIEDCTFFKNRSMQRGGAIEIFPGCDAFTRINRCTFTENEAPMGGAFLVKQPSGESIIENSLMVNNSSEAATVFIDTTNALLLRNCTVVNNQANGIEVANESTFTLQNTILYNPGFTNFADLTADNTVISNGGNLIGDGSFAGYANSCDQQNTAPLFVGANDYHLTEESPAVDMGVNSENLSETDLDGNGRVVSCIDIGAYESEFEVTSECCVVVNTREVIVGEVGLSPNPATDRLNIQLPETITQALEASLFDLQGKLIRRQTITNGQFLDLNGLPAGLYLIKVSYADMAFVGRFVKQ